MKDRSKLLLLFIAGLIFLGSVQCFGLDLSSEQCFSLSPALEKGENIFTYPKVRRLNEAEYTAVRRLLENIIGIWQGTMDELNCHGSEQDASKELCQYNVKAQASLDLEGNLTLTANSYNEEKRVHGRHLYTLVLKEKILRWGGDYGLVEPLSIRVERIYFMHRSSAYGLLREMYIAIEARENLLTIDEQIYARGKLTGRRFWYFKRER